MAFVTRSLPEGAEVTDGAGRRGLVRVSGGLVRGLRPKQWVKNVLVAAAPAAGGVLFRQDVLWHTCVAVVAFSLCASAGYLVNDAADVEADRRHPTKSNRPVASGLVPVGVARVSGVAVGVAGICCGTLLTTPALGLTLGVYFATTLAYSCGLKHVAVVELFMVTAGFLLRPLAGAAATAVAPSHWFLVVASFGSLYMVAGKRYAEVAALGEGAAGHRRILGEYPAAFLRQTRELALAVTVLAYCLWAFERAGGQALPYEQLSIIPFTYALLRYALLLERGHGGAPEDVVLGDRPLLLAGLSWSALFAAGVLTAGG